MINSLVCGSSISLLFVCFFFLAFVSCYLALLAVFLGDLCRDPKAAKILISAGCNQAGTCTHKQRKREDDKISTCFYKGKITSSNAAKQKHQKHASEHKHTQVGQWGHPGSLSLSLLLLFNYLPAGLRQSAWWEKWGRDQKPQRVVQHIVVFMINSTCLKITYNVYIMLA